MSSTQYRSFPLNVPPQLMYHEYIINWKQAPINVPWYINGTLIGAKVLFSLNVN